MRCRLYRPVTRKTSERLKIVNLNRRGIRTAPRTNQRWQRQRVSTNMRCRLYSRVARKTSERPKTVDVNRRGIRTANKSAIASQGGYADEDATSFCTAGWRGKQANASKPQARTAAEFRRRIEQMSKHAGASTKNVMSERPKTVNLNRRGSRTAPCTNQRWPRKRVRRRASDAVCIAGSRKRQATPQNRKLEPPRSSNGERIGGGHSSGGVDEISISFV